MDEKKFVAVTVRNVYGNDLVYPVNDTAGLFVAMLRVKTFTAQHLRCIKALGFEIRVAGGKLPFAL